MQLPVKISRFWLFAALSLIAYTILPFAFPLLEHFNRAPLRDIRAFAPSLAGGLGYGLLFLTLYALYTASWLYVKQHGASLRAVLAPVLLFCLPLLLSYPINATDIFRYFIRGRVTAIYGSSALTTPPNAFPQDPYLPLAGEWAGETSPYGPVWELLAGGITAITGDNLLLALLLFKALAIGAHVGLAVVIWRAAASTPSRQAANVLLWAWNPALLFMFAVDGHNDALMLLWLAAGYQLMKQRPVAGVWVACLGALTKPIGAVAIPFLVAGHWRTLAGRAERARFLAPAIGGACLLSFVAFLPLGSPLDLIIRLLTEASDAVGFSPGVLLILLAQRLAPGLDVGAALTLGASSGLIIFAAATLLLLWGAWRGRRVAQAIALAFAAYLASAFTFRIWYSTWPFAWLIVDPGPRRYALSAGYWFLLTAHLSLLIYGHLRIYQFQGDQLPAHLLGVPFTFLLPLLLARMRPLPDAE